MSVSTKKMMVKLGGGTKAPANDVKSELTEPEGCPETTPTENADPSWKNAFKTCFELKNRLKPGFNKS